MPVFSTVFSGYLPKGRYSKDMHQRNQHRENHGYFQPIEGVNLTLKVRQNRWEESAFSTMMTIQTLIGHIFAIHDLWRRRWLIKVLRSGFTGPPSREDHPVCKRRTLTVRRTCS